MGAFVRFGEWGRRAAWLATAASCWAWAGVASAQQLAAASAEENEEIIVVGEKTERSLQDTVSSVAVTTAERIEEENIQNLYDVIARTPNVTETYGPTGFSIRGITNNGYGGGQGGLATVYVDGAPLPPDSLFAGPLNMWDVSQVEILRGPQSTLQGRNALAGTIIVRSQDPTFDWDLHGRTLWSDGDDVSFALAGGGPIIEDQLAFRVALEDRSSDGFIYNPTVNEDTNARDYFIGRIKFLLTPTALPDLEARFSYTRTDTDAAYLFMYSRTDTPDFWQNRYDYSDQPNRTENVSDFYNLELDYEFNDRLSLSSTTSYSEVDDTYSYDGDLGPTSVSYGSGLTLTETLTQEIRLNYNGERFQGLVGIYYSDRNVEAQAASLTNVQTPVATISAVLAGEPFGIADQATRDFLAATYGAALPVIPVDYSSNSPSQVETLALFGDGALKLTPRWSLLAGFRYDREEFTITSDQTAVFAGTYPFFDDGDPMNPTDDVLNGINFVVDLFIAQANASAARTAREFEAFLPKLGVTYDWTDDISTSFVVQRGYRSGGSTINVARSSVVPYDPEYTWNYELSFRSSWLDGAMTLNANAFYIDWTDQQVSVNLGLNDYDYQTENAGASHLYGFELALNHRVTAEFDWYASLGHTQSEFDEFFIYSPGNPVPEDVSGSEFAYAPNWTLAAGANYRWSSGFIANVNASYRSDAFTDVTTNQDTWRIDARTLVNAKVGYEADHWGAYLFANNLLDENYIQYERSDQPLAVLGDPRVIGVILEARF